MKTLPVGVAQGKVLSAINVKAESWQEAEAVFTAVGIVVTSKRVGRSSEPVVRFEATRQGGWNVGGDGEAWDVPTMLTTEQIAALQPFVEK